jgi:hypothetical protein
MEDEYNELLENLIASIFQVDKIVEEVKRWLN